MDGALIGELMILPELQGVSGEAGVLQVGLRRLQAEGVHLRRELQQIPGGLLGGAIEMGAEVLQHLHLAYLLLHRHLLMLHLHKFFNN